MKCIFPLEKWSQITIASAVKPLPEYNNIEQCFTNIKTSAKKNIVYHMSSFEDPVEGKVLVGLIESSSLALCLWVLQCRPFHFVEVLESIPFQLFHPELLTCSQINSNHLSLKFRNTTLTTSHKIMVFLNIKLMGKMDNKMGLTDLQTLSIDIWPGWSDHKRSAVAHYQLHRALKGIAYDHLRSDLMDRMVSGFMTI